MHPLRRRLERSDTLAALLGGLAAGYVRLCQRTIRWETAGFDALSVALAEGPVIVVMWHSRLLLAPVQVGALAPFTTLRDPSPAGRLSAAMQTRLGMRPIEMAARGSNVGASRHVLRQLREGVSVGLTGDGPKGPARRLKLAPLDWARVSGAPVFLYAFSCTRQKRLNAWDAMLLPRPFGRGHAAVARWDADVPRRADADTMERLRGDLEAALTAHQARVDGALGLPPGP